MGLSVISNIINFFSEFHHYDKNRIHSILDRIHENVVLIYKELMNQCTKSIVPLIILLFLFVGLKKKKEAEIQVVKRKEDLYGFLPSDSETDTLRTSNRNLISTKVDLISIRLLTLQALCIFLNFDPDN